MRLILRSTPYIYTLPAQFYPIHNALCTLTYRVLLTAELCIAIDLIKAGQRRNFVIVTKVINSVGHGTTTAAVMVRPCGRCMAPLTLGPGGCPPLQRHLLITYHSHLYFFSFESNPTGSANSLDKRRFWNISYESYTSMDYIGILVSVLALRKLAGTVRTTNSKR